MYCRKCGTYMEDDSLFCTSCGTKISQAVNTNENSGVISNEEEVTNTAGKTIVKAEDILPQADLKETGKKEKKGSKRLLLIAAIFALLILFIFLFLMGGSQENGISDFAKWDLTKAEYLDYFDKEGTDIADDGNSISHWATGLFGEDTLRATCRYYFEEEDKTLSMVRIIALSTHVKDEEKLFDLYVETLENLIGPPDKLLYLNDKDGPYAKWETKDVVVEATITKEAILSEFFEKSYYENGGYKEGFYYSQLNKK